MITRVKIGDAHENMRFCFLNYMATHGCNPFPAAIISDSARRNRMRFASQGVSLKAICLPEDKGSERIRGKG